MSNKSIATLLKKLLRALLPQFLIEKRKNILLSRLLRREIDLRNTQPREETSINIRGDHNTSPETKILFDALIKTLESETNKLSDILNIEGMSGRKYRQLINEIISSMPDPHYLEIGSWAGSTACSAMYRNKVKVLCIDNWSQFGGPKEEFLRNVNATLSPDITFAFIEKDFRQVNYRDIGQFNIFLFDGPHTESDQYDGVRLPQPALNDTFLLIVDDWNWIDVRLGTFRAIADEKLQILFAIEIRTTHDNSLPTRLYKCSDWHNGYFFCICRKDRSLGSDVSKRP